jgi:large subunit ribosomal protein L2
MGKNLIQQRRGKGTATFRAPSFRYIGKVEYREYNDEEKKEKISGEIMAIEHSSGHYAPIIMVRYSDEQEALLIAPEGVRIGDKIEEGFSAEPAKGNTLPLSQIPNGMPVFNIETTPGDGGKLVRSSGVVARVLSKSNKEVVLQLPSKKKKSFNPGCRATIGYIAGAGRTEKPLLKAGNAYFKNKAKNKQWPHVSGIAMNAVAHPFGGSRSSKKNMPLVVGRFAPPGAKVGHIRPKRTGRKKL